MDVRGNSVRLQKFRLPSDGSLCPINVVASFDLLRLDEMFHLADHLLSVSFIGEYLKVQEFLPIARKQKPWRTNLSELWP